MPEVQGRRVRLRADRDRPDHDVVQPARRRQAAAVADQHLGDLPARDHQVERSDRSPPTTPASRCPTPTSSSPAGPTARARRRTSPSSSTLRPDPTQAATWKLGAASELEWPDGTQAGDGNSGVAQIVSSTEGAIGYVDLSDAKANNLTFALGEEQGRQVRRADARCHHRRRRERDDQRRPDLLPRLGRRRRRLPDRRPDLDHRLHQAGRPGQGRGHPRLPHLPADRWPETAHRRSTTRRCPPPCRPRRWPTSPRSAPDESIYSWAGALPGPAQLGGRRQGDS